MTIARFVRTTHENGTFRSFAPEALEFWRTQGVIVGEVIRSECAMTFAEIAAACQEMTLEHPEDHTHLPLDEMYIAWILVRLLEYGMVGMSAGPACEAWVKPTQILDANS